MQRRLGCRCPQRPHLTKSRSWSSTSWHVAGTASNTPARRSSAWMPDFRRRRRRRQTDRAIRRKSREAQACTVVQHSGAVTRLHEWPDLQEAERSPELSLCASNEPESNPFARTWLECRKRLKSFSTSRESLKLYALHKPDTQCRKDAQVGPARRRGAAYSMSASCAAFSSLPSSMCARASAALRHHIHKNTPRASMSCDKTTRIVRGSHPGSRSASGTIRLR